METNNTTKPYPAELREQAAEHGSQWSAIRSIAERVGCNAETLRLWVRRSERDLGARPGFRRASAATSFFAAMSGEYRKRALASTVCARPGVSSAARSSMSHATPRASARFTSRD
jgi:transposase-like protein